MKAIRYRWLSRGMAIMLLLLIAGWSGSLHAAQIDCGIGGCEKFNPEPIHSGGNSKLGQAWMAVSVSKDSVQMMASPAMPGPEGKMEGSPVQSSLNIVWGILLISLGLAGNRLFGRNRQGK